MLTIGQLQQKKPLWVRLAVSFAAIVSAATTSSFTISQSAPLPAITSLPNPDATGTLTIQKTVDGVRTAGTYELYQLTTKPDGAAIKPNTLTDWQKAITYTSEINAPGGSSKYLPKTSIGVKNTDATGKLVWSNLPVGIYYVIETRDASITQTLPFAFTMPSWDNENTNSYWNLKANVYPKNVFETENADIEIIIEIEPSTQIAAHQAVVPLTIVVKNIGTARASAVVAKVDLPDIYREYEHTAHAIDWPGKANGTVTEWTRPITFGSLHLDVGDLEVGHSVTYLVEGKINCSSTGQLTFHGHTDLLEKDIDLRNNDSTIRESIATVCNTGYPSSTSTPSITSTSSSTSTSDSNPGSHSPTEPIVWPATSRSPQPSPQANPAISPTSRPSASPTGTTKQTQRSSHSTAPSTSNSAGYPANSDTSPGTGAGSIINRHRTVPSGGATEALQPSASLAPQTPLDADHLANPSTNDWEATPDPSLPAPGQHESPRADASGSSTPLQRIGRWLTRSGVAISVVGGLVVAAALGYAVFWHSAASQAAQTISAVHRGGRATRWRKIGKGKRNVP